MCLYWLHLNWNQDKWVWTALCAWVNLCSRGSVMRSDNTMNQRWIFISFTSVCLYFATSKCHAQESLFLKWIRHRGKDKIATHQHDKNLLTSENWALKCSWMREAKLCRWHPGLISDPHVRLWPAEILMQASVCLKIA